VTRPYTLTHDELLTMSEEQVQQEQAPETPQPSGEECEICDTEMYGLHCKLVCPNCGYRRDCSDP
jgi:hypothetical protein